jgi:hypothetical protein
MGKKPFAAVELKKKHIAAKGKKYCARECTKKHCARRKTTLRGKICVTQTLRSMNKPPALETWRF